LGLARRQRAVEERGAHPQDLQRLDLVFHQRDERRYHHRRARPQDGRHLVAQRLAPAGRHEYQRVVAIQHGLDDRALLAPELLVAEHAPQDVESTSVSAHGREFLDQSAHSPRRMTASVEPSASTPSTSTWADPIMKSTWLSELFMPAASCCCWSMVWLPATVLLYALPSAMWQAAFSSNSVS